MTSQKGVNDFFKFQDRNAFGSIFEVNTPKLLIPEWYNVIIINIILLTHHKINVIIELQKLAYAVPAPSLHITGWLSLAIKWISLSIRDVYPPYGTSQVHLATPRPGHWVTSSKLEIMGIMCRKRRYRNINAVQSSYQRLIPSFQKHYSILQRVSVGWCV